MILAVAWNTYIKVKEREEKAEDVLSHFIDHVALMTLSRLA